MPARAAWAWVAGSAFLALLVAGLLRPSGSECGPASREARRISDLKNVQAALASYHRTHGVYPSTEGAWRGDMEVLGGHGYDAQGYIPGLVPQFLPSLPKDPDSQFPDHRRGYMYRSDGVDYKFVLLGTPESFDEGNPYLDPARIYCWQVSSAGAASW